MTQLRTQLQQASADSAAALAATVAEAEGRLSAASAALAAKSLVVDSLSSRLDRALAVCRTAEAQKGALTAALAAAEREAERRVAALTLLVHH